MPGKIGEGVGRVDERLLLQRHRQHHLGWRETVPRPLPIHHLPQQHAKGVHICGLHMRQPETWWGFALLSIPAPRHAEGMKR